MPRGTPDPDRKVAWSSDPAPPLPAKAPAAPPPKAPATVVRVRLERQGRGGKAVTVVDGLPGHPAAIEDVARRLRAACAAGGTTKGRLVEVQGDHRDRVVAVLAGLGIAAKRS
jgi:translation initiation factor 1